MASLIRVDECKCKLAAETCEEGKVNLRNDTMEENNVTVDEKAAEEELSFDTSDVEITCIENPCVRESVNVNLNPLVTVEDSELHVEAAEARCEDGDLDDGGAKKKVDFDDADDYNVSEVDESGAEEGTSILSEDHSNCVNGSSLQSGSLVTSTPCSKHNTCKRNAFNSSVRESGYKPPARSVLEKWRPTLLADRYEKLDCSSRTVSEGIADISAIETTGLDPPMKALRSSNRIDTNDNDNGFEAAFHSLYETLFDCDNAEKADCENVDGTIKAGTSNISKLELYHDNIVEMRKRDDEKFDEIICEISTMSNQHFVTIDETGIYRKMNRLSAVIENELHVLDDKTIVLEDDKVEDRTICNTVEKSEGKTCDLKEESDKQNAAEAVQVSVINGANSIIYLNNRELTLDEENALLNSDTEDDAISLICSDIDDLTQGGSIKKSTGVVRQMGRQTQSYGIKNDVDQSESTDIKAGDAILPTNEEILDEGISVVKHVSETLAAENPQEHNAVPVSVLDDRNLPFISADPKENEDNNDPQWEHLRRLKNDKERYKALRERWHSIIIPDPNLDLTSQTYRQNKVMKMKGCELGRANLVETTTVQHSRKRIHSGEPDDSGRGPAKKKRKCTTLFEESVQQLLKKWEFKRFCLYHEMDDKFVTLARKQEEEASKCQFMSAYNTNTQIRHLSKLHAYQVKEVQKLHEEYTEKISKAEQETKEYVAALNAASEEVYTFHKFYQDLNIADDENGYSMYLTDTQFQELVETENMLDLYSKFYN